jgi:hypothetical protein
VQPPTLLYIRGAFCVCVMIIVRKLVLKKVPSHTMKTPHESRPTAVPSFLAPRPGVTERDCLACSSSSTSICLVKRRGSRTSCERPRKITLRCQSDSGRSDGFYLSSEAALATGPWSRLILRGQGFAVEYKRTGSWLPLFNWICLLSRLELSHFLFTVHNGRAHRYSNSNPHRPRGS